MFSNIKLNIKQDLMIIFKQNYWEKDYCWEG